MTRQVSITYSQDLLVARQLSEEELDPALELDPSFDLDRGLSDLENRERRRSGPGTAARRTLEALAEHRRLSRELADLDDIEF